MRQVSVQIESRADARPKVNEEHDREVGPLEARPERHDPEHLQPNEDHEEEEIEFIVLKHEAR